MHAQNRQVSSADNLCKLFDTLMIVMKEFFEKVDFEKYQQSTKNMQNNPVGIQLTIYSKQYTYMCILLRAI